MEDEAWVTIQGLYNLLYNEIGLAFQTPEALKTDKVYRSLGYMRALAIWSIQYALESKTEQKQ
jgi:non-lysosomal glucosylceramidase